MISAEQARQLSEENYSQSRWLGCAEVAIRKAAAGGEVSARIYIPSSHVHVVQGALEAEGFKVLVEDNNWLNISW